MDPDRRVTAAEALGLPYFSEFREPEEETEAQPYDTSLDNTELPLEQWKREGREGTGGGDGRRGVEEREGMEWRGESGWWVRVEGW